jgi:hypothetical protein
MGGALEQPFGRHQKDHGDKLTSEQIIDLLPLQGITLTGCLSVTH